MQDDTSPPLVLFTGGGTGGHVYPGLAVLDRLTERTKVRTAWIGDRNGMERAIVEARGITFIPVPTGKLRRYLSLRNVGDLFRVAGGVIASVQVIRKLRPVALFSKGGFVSVPPVIAAGLLGIPVISHESDSDPGLATRINSRFSRRILVPYESSIQHFSAGESEKISVVGNPIRQDLAGGSRERGLEHLGFGDDPRPIALFLGGSQGARQINELVDLIRPSIRESWRIVHQTGANAAPTEPRENGYVSIPFIGDELPDIMAAADLLVCRSGANTLWEGASLGKPMLLIPLVVGSRGDQVRNAELFRAAGAAEVFTDPVTLAGDVTSALLRLARGAHDGRAQRSKLGIKARALVNDDATDRIVDAICDYIGTGGT